MFLKQYNYKPRQASVSESSSGTQQQQQTRSPSPPKDANVSAAIAGRRRSSLDQKYAGLNGYKRSSMDGKRESYADQSVVPGVLGGMWANFTKGSK